VFCIQSAGASSVTITDPFLMLLNISDNTIGDTTGQRLRFGADAVIPNGNNGDRRPASIIASLGCLVSS
jgi:hypothetical protein